MKVILEHIIKGNKLSFEEAKTAMLHIGKGEVNQSQIASFLTVFMMRKVEPMELYGFRSALLELCVQLDFKDFNTMDLCGTGGDGKNTFNVSTISSFVTAAAGIQITKHGNYAVSSAVGSSDLINGLGYVFPKTEDQLKRELDYAGITFLHAPIFHPAMKGSGPIRKELGMKTVFNLLGPLVNPVRPKMQLTGVYDQSILPLYKYALDRATEKYAVVFSEDVYDEISLTGKFVVIGKNGERVYSPERVGLVKTFPAEIIGGATASEASELFIKIISAKGSKAQNEVIAANAGLAISVAKNITFEAGIAEAKEIIQSGKAALVLKKLLEINNA